MGQGATGSGQVRIVLYSLCCYMALVGMFAGYGLASIERRIDQVRLEAAMHPLRALTEVRL